MTTFSWRNWTLQLRRVVKFCLREWTTFHLDQESLGGKVLVLHTRGMPLAKTHTLRPQQVNQLSQTTANILVLSCLLLEYMMCLFHWDNGRYYYATCSIICYFINIQELAVKRHTNTYLFTNGDGFYERKE